MNDQSLLDAVAAELAAVVGALLDSPATAAPATAPAAPRWVARLKLTGPVDATIAVGLTAESAAALAKGVMALDTEPADDAVTDTLSEVCGQAVGALSQRDELKGLRLGECKVDSSVPSGAPALYDVRATGRFEGVLSLWLQRQAGQGAVAAAVAASDHAPMPANLDVILDIDLPLTVRFGESEMTLLALTRIAPGSVIDLGRSPDEPVDVLVNGRLIARGEVVVVGGNYGVRITEVISAADRLRSVAA